MNQDCSPFSKLFSAFQVILLLLLGYLYIQNNIFGVLQNFHGNDFAHNYVAGYLLRYGGNPYDRPELLTAAASLGIPRINPYVYPLFVAELFIPLSAFSYPTAKFIWFILNHLFFIGSICIYISTLPKLYRRMSGILFLGFSVMFFPLVRTLTAGQLNLLVLFLIVLLWKLYVGRKNIGAGFVLGIATLTKVFPILFVFYFLVKKEYKIVISALATLFIISFATILLVGFGPFVDYFGVLKSMAYGHSVWADVADSFHVDPANQSIHAFLARIFTLNSVTKPWLLAPGLAKGLSIVISLCLLVLSTFLAMKSWSLPVNPLRETVLFNFSFLSYLLIPSLFWDHYLVYLLFPLMSFLIYLVSSNVFSLKKILFIILFCYLPMAIPFNFWSDSYRQGINILWMSFKLYPMLLLWSCMVIILYRSTNSIK